MGIGTRFLFVTLLAVFLCLAVTIPSHSEGSGPTVCNGTFSHESTEGLLVPGGAICDLQGSTVSGAIEVRSDGTLQTENSVVTGDLTIARGGKATLANTQFQGNLTAAKAQVQLNETAVRGELTLADGGSLMAFKADLLKGISGSGAGLEVLLDTSQLRGNVRFNSGSSIEIRTSQAGKNILIGGGMVPARKGSPLKLINSQVAGDVTVRSGRLLQFDESQVRGSLDLGKLALIGRQSTVYGEFEIAPGGSAHLVKSAVGGSLKATSAKAKLVHSSVAGKVGFHKGGLLTADVARIGGDLVGAGKRFKAVITGSSMKSGVTVKSGHSVRIKRSKVADNLDISRIRDAVAVEIDSIKGSVKIHSNVAARAGIRVFRNSINGSLSCFSNHRSPFGGRNGVRGKKKGQCSKL